MSDILIIDDDPGINTLLVKVAHHMGCQARCADTARRGLDAVQRESYDLVLLDVGLPDGNGLHLLPHIRQTANPPEVIIITGNGDPNAAEMAIKNGAWDYLVKPTTMHDMMLKIERALAYHKAKGISAPPKVLKRETIVGDSPCLNTILERVAHAAASESNVLICGETGTGKELFARAIHANSLRAEHPFVVVDCASLPATLVESILFGHAKGAFTGADKEHDGLIRQAHGGTLFLDEVGELPMSIQKNFLRVIQERRFRPVSGQNEVAVDFRLITATNRDLEAMVAEGAFRDDLLFRLRNFSIDAAPLRRRIQDIQSLTIHHLNRLCGMNRCETKGLSNDFIEALQQYTWPGNVRELFHALEDTLCSAGPEPTLYPHHLPVRIRAAIARLSVQTTQTGEVKQAHTADPAGWTKEGWMDMATYRDRMERRYLEQLLQATQGNRKEACR
ncbi:MAG: sigma-54 dependent transcriptional regulator, partial [Desulfatitalea sp.]